MRTLRSLQILIGRAGVLTVCAALVGAASAQAAAIGAYTTHGAWSFLSAPKLHPPKLTIDKSSSAGRLAAGYFMVTNFPNLGVTEPAHGKAQRLVGQSGPLILDKHLQPIWFAPVPTNVVAGNLRAQSFEGQPVLTWWQGVITPTGQTTQGEDVVVNQHYQKVATLTGQDGWVISEHEMIVSGHDAWVTAYKPLPMNLAAFHGLSNGVLLDAAVQEYDLTNGDLLGTWDAMHHVPLSQSEQPAPNTLVRGKVPAWDAYHVNSIQLVRPDKLLVSMRNTWAAYLVDTNSINLDASTIEWALGGKPFAGIATFTFAKHASFQWQHDVEVHSGNLVSIFDDACCQITTDGKVKLPTGPSRGLEIRIDASRHTASFVAQYTRGRNFNVAYLGNDELLPDGNVVVGWGAQSYFSEFSKSGKLLFEAKWPGPDQSYRALAQRWIGTPSAPPTAAVRKRGGNTTVYASWNGSTQVKAWRVLAGSSAGHLKAIVRKMGKTGFETAISLRGHGYNVYEVKALDSGGHVLGTSKTLGHHGASSTPPPFY
jgi:hypothetical protein